MKKIKHMDRVIISKIGKLLFKNTFRFLIIIYGVVMLYKYFG